MITIKHDHLNNTTRVEDDRGRELLVSGVQFEREPNKPAKATLVLATNLECKAKTVDWRVAHPSDHDLRRVKRIEFADGTEWRAP